MSDTAGFYKAEGDRLLYAPNFVHASGFSLLRETHASETYPVDGWEWFEDAATAYEAHGLPSWTDPEDELDDLTTAIIMGL